MKQQGWHENEDKCSGKRNKEKEGFNEFFSISCVQSKILYNQLIFGKIKHSIQICKYEIL